MAITAAVVNELRQATGCGLMDCKKALIECEGDMEKAVMYLREKGLASQAKKASRVAAEGMAYATVIDGVGVVVEVNCETDFVANGEPFNNFVKGVAAVVAKENPADVDALMGCPWVTGNGTVKDAKDELFLAIRENMSIRRFARIADGFSVPYVHMKGKIGVIVNLTVEGCDATEIGKDIAMQIAALNPTYKDKSDVSAEFIEKEKEIRLAQAKEDPKNAKKPDAIIEKIVMGGIGKYFKEICLLQQPFVKDDKVTISQLLKSKGASVASFGLYVVGEGLEKRNEDFAAEVAAQQAAAAKA